MTETDKTTFALVGCGRVATQHLRALAYHGTAHHGTAHHGGDHQDDDQHSARAEVVAVCDPDAARLAEACTQTGAAGYQSLEALLAEISPDVVVLASPSGLHPRQTELAAAAGCHVMCEKPIATDFDAGAAMVAACEHAGVHLFVVKQLRYNPTIQLLHRALHEGRFGEVSLVDVDVFWTRPQEYYDRDAWRGTRELDGGAFLNQTSHYVDLLTWLFGPVDSVQGYMATLGRDIEVEDSGVLSLQWACGALGSMSVTMLTFPENLRASMTIAGSRGTAVLGGKACDEIEVWRFDEAYETDEEIARLNRQTRQFYGDGHLAYYANVLDVLEGRAEPDTDGREGLKSLEVICAGYRSAEEGRRIELPLEIA